MKLPTTLEAGAPWPIISYQSLDAPNMSEVPRRHEIESGGFKVSDITRSQAATIYPGYRSNHAIGCRHSLALPYSCPHNLPINQCSFLSQTKNAIGKSATPVLQTLLQPVGTLIRPDLLNSIRNFCDCHRRQRKLGIMSN